MNSAKPARVLALFAATLFAFLLAPPSADAKTEWLIDFIQEYPGASRLGTCGICHRKFTSDSQGENPYGKDFKSAGGKSNPRAAMRAIEGDDSDGDGFTNLAEIMMSSGFMPGYDCNNYTDTSNAPADLASYVDPNNIGCLAPATTTTTRPRVTTTTAPRPTTTTTTPRPTTTTVARPTTTTITVARPTTTTTSQPGPTTTLVTPTTTTITRTTPTTTTTTLPPCTPGQACGETLLYPIADTYIQARREATWDHGEARHLEVDAAPFSVAYLKFDLAAIPGLVTRATLRLHVTNRSKDAGAIYRILDTQWSEGVEAGTGRASADGPGLKWIDVDWNADGRLDDLDGSPLNPDSLHLVTELGRVKKRQRYEFDVTSAFQDGPGAYTLAIMTSSRDGAAFGSNEHPYPARRPALIIESVALDDEDPFCGDGVLTAPEECDEAADAACPDHCAIDCTCAPAPAAPTGGEPEEPDDGSAALSPVADTYIEAGDEAAWNHGASDHLDVDASPSGITYLKFDLSSVRQPVRGATLQLYVTNKSRDAGSIYLVPATDWVEGTGNGIDATSTGGPGLTWRDVDTNGDGELDTGDASPLRPEPAARVVSLGAVRKGAAYRINVTAAFQDGPGLYTLAIMNESTDGTTFSSREHPSADQRPVLYINGEDAR
jgi:hypothetical protein